MRTILSLCLALLASSLLAQDTIMVHTLTFDSITTRRGWFQFPDTSHHFRKVLMHHTLKCSPLTTWDQYNCGEWDYLTYHFVHEHMGVNDSTALTHPHFLVGTATLDSVRSIVPQAFNEHQRWQRMAVVDSVANNVLSTVGMPDTTDAESFITFKRRSQYLYTAEELAAAGLVAGPVHELRFHALAPGAALIDRCIVRMKNTSDTALSRFDDLSLITVFDQHLTYDTLALALFTPFIWDGVSNILVDIANEGWDVWMDVSIEASLAQPGTALREIGADNAVRTDNDFIGIDPAPLAGLSDAVTITFRTFGAPELPMNTSLLEAVGANGQRILNIHLPWSNGRIYWDAGSDGSAYDRIDKQANEAEFEGGWTDWAFVKNAATGSMKIYKNGALWFSGTGKTKPLGGIIRMRVGSDANGGNPYPGMIDGLNIFSTEVSAATIAAWYDRKTTSAHPDFGSLLYSIEMDEGVFPGLPFCANAVNTDDQAWLMGSVKREERPATALFRNPSDPGTRPVITFGQGDYAITIDSLLTSAPYTDFLPQLAREYFAVQGNSVVPVDTVFEYNTGWSFIYGPDGNVIDSAFADGTLYINDTLHYFGVPYEVVYDREIGRYITPYGIGLSLGTSGFRWTYDVTDYQWLLHDSVDLSAGNTQELIDLSFAMIEGTPPREVIDMKNPWGPQRSYGYGGLSDDSQLSAVTVPLSPQAHEWMLLSRFTGHGDATSFTGVQGCCEFKDNTHYLYANGQQVDQWHVWRTDDCASNPVYPQGGSWVYAREGWCPGDAVKDHATELTPYVNNDSLTLDYGITPVPQDNPGMAGGNYVVNMDLFEYDHATHDLDAEIYNVKRPSDAGLYSRDNPICYDPLLTLRNDGTQDLTSVNFYYHVSGGVGAYSTWTGVLHHMQAIDVQLPVSSDALWNGDDQHLFTVEIIDVNGGGSDFYHANDNYTTHFNLPVVYPDNFVLYYKTNNHPQDNELYVRDVHGNVVFSRTTFTPATTYRDTLHLEPGCYTMEFTDSANDGLYFYWSDQDTPDPQGTGFFRFRSLTNLTLKNFPAEFGHSLKFSFGIGTIESIAEQPAGVDFRVQPNPSTGAFTLITDGVQGSARIDVLDLTGRLVRTQGIELYDHARNLLDLSTEPDGVYLVRLVSERGSSLLRLVKQ